VEALHAREETIGGPRLHIYFLASVKEMTEMPASLQPDISQKLIEITQRRIRVHLEMKPVLGIVCIADAQMEEWFLRGVRFCDCGQLLLQAIRNVISPPSCRVHSSAKVTLQFQ
jgi:hypothetical protein